MEKSEYKLTPDVLSRLSIAQTLMVFQSNKPGEALDHANEWRRRRGMTPIERSK
jgi:hypothetical protein